MPLLWHSITLHWLEDKAQEVQVVLAGLFLDIQGVLWPFGDFPLKVGLNSHKTFKFHLLIIPKVQEFRSYTRL